MKTITYRTEHDLLGERQVEADVYYGIHTLRALENFPITGTTIQIYPGLIRALAYVKEACALANLELGLLDEKRAKAIVQACQEIRAGKLHEHFVVDVIQGGAGTSTNMNANEVIANRALEILGFERGNYKELHPLEQVNLSQSTNDVYPTSVKVALRFEIDNLVAAMDVLYVDFDKKAKEFADILKMGRTQLQDAVPMTLGQEFSTYAVMLTEDMQRLREAALLIQEINLGATAIGTGINAPLEYAPLACKTLSELTGYQFIKADNLVEATQDAGSSGPRAGLGEINLPPVQAGSSIMPGKVNPVIPEVVNQIAFEVIGNDVTVSFAAEAGQLQLNAFEPVIAHNLLNSLIYLRQGCLTLAERCVRGITANRERLHDIVAHSIGIVTALNPYIGYENASAVAKEAAATGKGVAEIVLDRGLLTKEQLDDILRPENLTQPRRVL
jgi:aspartate ammonia-lyase